MRLTGIDNLEVTGVFGNLAQAIEVGKNQVRALVTRGAPGETDRKNLGVQMEARLLADFFKQFVFSDEVRRPHIFRGQAQRASQTEIVFAPRRNVAVKELLARGA